MPLLPVQFPANANFFITFLISVATFDMLPAQVIPFIFTFPENEPYTLGFDNCQYGSIYAVENLGTAFVLLNIYMIQLVEYYLLKLCKNHWKRAARWHDNLEKALFWGTLIRFLFEGYLELCFSVFVSIDGLTWDTEFNSVYYNNAFSMILSAMLVGLPFFIFFYYGLNIDSLDDDEFI